jgi:hypothetical protein
MLQIGEHFHENLTLEKVDELINKYKAETKHSSYLDGTTFRKN